MNLAVVRLITVIPSKLGARPVVHSNVKVGQYNDRRLKSVGEIESLKLNQPGAPLVYLARMYEQLGESGSLSLEDMEYSWERYT